MITDERIAELRAECEPLPEQAEPIFVDASDFDADPDRWINLAGPTQAVVVVGVRGVGVSMGGTYRIPLEITRGELRAILDRMCRDCPCSDYSARLSVGQPGTCKPGLRVDAEAHKFRDPVGFLWAQYPTITPGRSRSHACSPRARSSAAILSHDHALGEGSHGEP